MPKPILMRAAPALAIALLAACTTTLPPRDAAPAAATVPAPRLLTVTESYVSAESPADELDSLATWPAADGRTWLIASAKSTHRMVVFDADSGERLRDFGVEGSARGQFDRPNGIAVFGDHLFVV
jgi:3-phytase